MSGGRVLSVLSFLRSFIVSRLGGGLSSSEELLLMAAENLKMSIEHAVSQLSARKVRGDMKLRWSRSLTRQVEALVKVAEALNKIGSSSAADLDLASYLSSLETKVPKRFVTEKFARVVRMSRLSRFEYEHRRLSRVRR